MVTIDIRMHRNLAPFRSAIFQPDSAYILSKPQRVMLDRFKKCGRSFLLSLYDLIGFRAVARRTAFAAIQEDQRLIDQTFYQAY